MPLAKLTAKQVERATKPGRYGDGGGLWLQVSRWKTKSWVFQYTMDGRVRQRGLGPLHTVSLAQAREEAAMLRRRVRDGIDPIEAKQKERLDRRLAQAKAISFGDCAERYIKAKASEWNNEKHRKQWTSTLQTYADPVLGKLPVAAVDTGLVLKVLEPIWNDKPETATRVRQRIEAVLNYATAREYRQGENPALERASR